MKQAESMACLDTWSDEVVTSVMMFHLQKVDELNGCNERNTCHCTEDVNTWGLYECHSGDNQKFVSQGSSRYCTYVDLPGQPQCFMGHEI